MKFVCFSICPVIVIHPNQWAIVELRSEKDMTMRRLDKSMCGAILASA